MKRVDANNRQGSTADAFANARAAYESRRLTPATQNARLVALHKGVCGSIWERPTLRTVPLEKETNRRARRARQRESMVRAENAIKIDCLRP